MNANVFVKLFHFLLYLGKMVASLCHNIHLVLFKRFSCDTIRLAGLLEQLNEDEKLLQKEQQKIQQQYRKQIEDIERRRTKIEQKRMTIVRQLAQSNWVTESVASNETPSPPQSQQSKRIELEKSESVKQLVKRFNKPSTQVVNLPESKTKNDESKIGFWPPWTAKSDTDNSETSKKKQLYQITSGKVKSSRKKSNEQDSNANVAMKPTEQQQQQQRQVVIVAEMIQRPISTEIQFHWQQASQCVNSYIDLIVEKTIAEFQCTTNGRLRGRIEELYHDPDWRPLINDLKRHYHIFAYL